MRLLKEVLYVFGHNFAIRVELCYTYTCQLLSRRSLPIESGTWYVTAAMLVGARGEGSTPEGRKHCIRTLQPTLPTSYGKNESGRPF